MCQRLAFGLIKIFATSNDTNLDAGNSGTNINVYDRFVTNCFKTYKEVMKRVLFDQEMLEQCESTHDAFRLCFLHPRN